MKGVFNLRPALPSCRYKTIWDVDKILILPQRWLPVKFLNLKRLTFKLLMLFALLSGQRGQSLHCLALKDINVGK